MGKYAELFNYFRQCPVLSELWSIAATEETGTKVILPQGASPVGEYVDSLDVNGNYACEFVPNLTVYEDFQINCYQWYDAKDKREPEYNSNVLSIEEVQSICDWVKKQNDMNNLPVITGTDVVAVECVPFVPQIRYADEIENIMAYFVTVRVYYVNKAQRKSVCYEYTD